MKRYDGKQPILLVDDLMTDVKSRKICVSVSDEVILASELKEKIDVLMKIVFLKKKERKRKNKRKKISGINMQE